MQVICTKCNYVPVQFRTHWDGGFFHCIIILCDYKAIQTELQRKPTYLKVLWKTNDDNDAFLIVVWVSSWNIIYATESKPYDIKVTPVKGNKDISESI